MTEQTQWTRELVMEYFVAYAKYEKVRIDECIKINSEKKIRGDIGAAEMEYRCDEEVLIVRGLIDKRLYKGNPKFSDLLLEKILSLNDTIGNKFDGAKFEFDETASALQADFPRRLNLRIDFHTPPGKTEFVKRVDNLMDESYTFKVNEYQKIFDEVNRIVFPPKK